MNKKKSFSREEAESNENLEQITNDVPGNRMQSTQQVQTVADAEGSKAPDSSFKAKKTTAKGSSLKQQVISDVITGSEGSAGIGMNAAGRAVSGTVGGILGANNSTPQAGQARSESRTGKKLDRVATKLNYTPSEQVLLTVDESKPLADAAGLDQGYNGTYRNEFARSQKVMGAVPGDLMFQRSVDFIMKDKLYFAEGQMVFQTDDNTTNYDPQFVYDLETQTLVPTTIHAGNFLHKNIHIGLGESGKVIYCYFDVDDITPAAVSADDANCASAHRLIKSNVAELDRMNMDAKAGDEKADIWTPLARAIPDPTKWSYLLSSIEADTGAYAYLAYSKASTNFAFQLNRAAKDGLDVVGPAIEQCLGWRSDYDNSIDLDDSCGNTLHPDRDDVTHTHVFSTDCYRLGDPTILIETYDSINKYNNKADLLLQPRGWRMHLQTADNNIDSLKVPAEFVNVFSGTEAFSTIDREYDPLLPICFTDKANLITSHNLNELAAFANNFGCKTLSCALAYENIESDYLYDEYLLLRKKSGAVFKGLGYGDHVYVLYKKNGMDGLVFDASTGIISVEADNTERTAANFDIIVSNTASVTGYTALAVSEGVYTFDNYAFDVVVHVPQVQHEGALVNSNEVSAVSVSNVGDVNWYYNGCKPLAYKYSDLRNNYVVKVRHPLVGGIIDWLNESVGGKILGLIKQEDFFIPLIFSTQYMTLAQLVICASTPWIQRVRQNSMKDIIYYEDNVKEYPFSKLISIKDAPFKNYVNFNYTDYDHPLETKVMNPVQAINWIMPEFFWKLADTKIVCPWYFNELDLNNDGTVDDDANNMSMPSIRSGIRLGFLDDLYGMDEKDIRLSLDRMTKTFLRNEDFTNKYAYKYGRTTDGQIVIVRTSGNDVTIGELLKAPRELGLSMDAPLGILSPDPSFDENHLFKRKGLTDSGIATSYRIRIFTNRKTLKQPSILANSDVNIDRGANYVQKWFELSANAATSGTDIAGLIFGMNDDAHTYAPFADLGTGAAHSISINVNSYMRSVNTRLQFLPFIISPFDAVPNASQNYDIYDIAYWFGLAGFRASDYRESVYNRSKEVINQGFLFTEDPWILASPILRGASGSTGVKMSKGYTIR